MNVPPGAEPLGPPPGIEPVAAQVSVALAQTIPFGAELGLDEPFAIATAAIMTEIHKQLGSPHGDPLSLFAAATRAPAVLGPSSWPGFVAGSLIRMLPPAPADAEKALAAMQPPQRDPATNEPSAPWQATPGRKYQYRLDDLLKKRQPQQPTPLTAATTWSRGDVVKELLKLLGINQELDWAELTGRLAIASAMAWASRRIASIEASDMETGKEVHKLLQETYRNHLLNAFHTIVTERQVWGPAYPGGPPLSGESLEGAALTYDAHFRALELALKSPFGGGGDLRTDLTDFSAAQVWEIKPIYSAHQGVLQETWYRCAYNLQMKAMSPAGGALGPLGSPVTYMRLNDGLWWPFQAFIPRAISNHPVDGYPRVMVPIPQYELLGLFIYAVIRLDKVPEDLVKVVLAALFKLMLDRIKRQRRRPGAPPGVPVPVKEEGLVPLPAAALAALLSYAAISVIQALNFSVEIVASQAVGAAGLIEAGANMIPILVLPQTLPKRERFQDVSASRDPLPAESTTLTAAGYGVRTRDLPDYVELVAKVTTSAYEAGLRALSGWATPPGTATRRV